ncbi:MAG: outer membrane protein [Candidatus Berkiellales bacterium]
MKKISTALCLSAMLIATAAEAQWQGNFLIGASAGWGRTDGNVNFELLPPRLPETAFSTDNDNDGWLWGILAGYQARCNEWLVGGEVSVDWTQRHDNNTVQFTDTANRGWTETTSFKRDALIAFTGRIGYAVSDFFLPYARAGIETAEDKLNFSGNANDGTVFNTNGSHRSWNFIGGLGAEMPIPVLTGLSARLEWNYHAKGHNTTASGIASDGTLVAAETKPSANTGKFSLVYNFI